MTGFLDVLLHPSRWSTVGELAPEERIGLAVGALVLTTVVAFVTAVVTARWARRIAGGRSRAVGRVQRGVVALVAAFGAYTAVEMAPLPPGVERVLSGATFVLAAFVGARLIIQLVALTLTTSVTHVGAGERERLEREYVPLVTKLTTLAVSLMLVVVVAKHFGQDVTSLVAALGVGSLAIGLAAQQTLGNMIAGFTLLADRPFRPGDRIKLATGEVGEVLDIGVRSTRIVLPDRNLLIVPNNDLVSSRVVNFAFPTPAARGSVQVTIGYGADVERASRELVALALDDTRVAREPAPVVRVVALGAVGIDLACGFEVTSHVDVAAVEDALRRRLLVRFAEEKIDLPFPRTDVYLLNK